MPKCLQVGTRPTQRVRVTRIPIVLLAKRPRGHAWCSASSHSWPVAPERGQFHGIVSRATCLSGSRPRGRRPRVRPLSTSTRIPATCSGDNPVVLGTASSLRYWLGGGESRNAANLIHVVLVGDHVLVDCGILTGVGGEGRLVSPTSVQLVTNWVPTSTNCVASWRSPG